MKKVRVERELPFAKVGEIITQSRDGSYYATDSCRQVSYTEFQIETLIQDGWLSWVEEEQGLEEKFAAHESLSINYARGDSPDWEKISEIATLHFQERFDRAWKERNKTHRLIGCDYDAIRQAIFGEE